jgi:hypothetical protein
MSSSKKKLTCKGTLRQVFICLRPETHTPPPHSIREKCMKYAYSHREGGGGEELNQREKERGDRSQSWVENTNMVIWMDYFISSL